MEQQTHRKHYAIEGGKERILKVKPKGGEWGNEFHRIFYTCVYKRTYYEVCTVFLNEAT